MTPGSQGVIARLFAVPVFVKVMGIGVVVALIFGVVTILAVRAETHRVMCQLEVQRTLAIARSLATELQRPVILGDIITIREKIDRVRQSFVDVRYVLVRDASSRVVAHTFPGAVPPDLVNDTRLHSNATEEAQIFSTEDGWIFDTVQPLLQGVAGSVQIGVSDQLISRELAGVTRTVLAALALCALIGSVLAFALTSVLTRPIGALMVSVKRVTAGDLEARAPITFRDEIGALAEAFNQMTASLERSQGEIQDKEKARTALLDRLVSAQEEERKRIAHELHDEFGQSLLGLHLALQASPIKSCLGETVCSDIVGRVRRIVDEVRRLASGMRPAVLDDHGLDPALVRMVEETRRDSKLEIDYHYSRPVCVTRLPERLEITLYRIAQEAIANVVRHAGATRASLVVVERSDEITLIVEDDGRGFEPSIGSDVPIRRGIGLLGMQERAALVGGRFAIESGAGRGTTVKVRIPLDGRQACPTPSAS